MPKFNVSVEHQTTREVAVVRIRGFSDRIRNEFSGQVTEVTEVWDNQGNLQFSFRTMGLSVDGGVLTDEESIHVTGNLPFAALPFRGVIEQTIADKISEALSDFE